MLKNLTLIPLIQIFIIVITFSNLTFATAPLKWRGGKLFDVIQDEKIYTTEMFSNHSSLEERAICPAGHQCPGTNICCPTICASPCGSSHCCKPNYFCCGDGTGGCCPIGNNCCGLYCCKLGQLCVGNLCMEAYIPKSKPTKSSIPKNTDISKDLTEKSKYKSSDYRSTAANSNGETPVYVYNPTTGCIYIERLKEIRIYDESAKSFKVDSILEADHVFEAQILPNYLKTMGEAGKKIYDYILDNPDVLDKLKKIINDESNLRFLTSGVNNSKGKIYLGQNAVNRDAVRDYLSNDDVFNAFSKTRDKVIDFLHEVTTEAFKGVIIVRRVADDLHMVTNEARKAPNEVNVNYIDNSFDKYSRSLYEELTNRKLPKNKYSNSSSSLSLPYLPAILSITLSLMFLISEVQQYLIFVK